MALAGIQNQQGFHHRIRGQSVDDAAHLGQLLHQVVLGLQPTSRIHQNQLGALGLGCTNGVKHHGSWIRIGAGIGNHRHIAAITPNLHLLNGRGPEGIGRRNQTAVATAHGQVGQLAQGGGFAHPIHAHHQPHVEAIPLGSQQGMGTGLDRLIQDAAELFLQETDPLAGVDHLLIEAFSQGFEHLVGGLNAHIGPQQGAFQVIEHLGGEGVVTKVFKQLGDKPLAGFLQALAQARKPINLLKGNLIDPFALGGQHLRRPGEGVIKSTELGLRGRGVWRTISWRCLGRLGGSNGLLAFHPLGRGLLQ